MGQLPKSNTENEDPRAKMVDVLDNDYCEHNLTQNGTLTFVHKPEVLCVGLNISYNIRVYLKGSRLKNNEPKLIYKHVPRNDDRYKNLVSKEDMWYIVGKCFFHHFVTFEIASTQYHFILCDAEMLWNLRI